MGKIIYAQNALLVQIINLSLYIVQELGFGTETLAGNFKGKGAKEQLVPLARARLDSGYRRNPSTDGRI